MQNYLNIQVSAENFKRQKNSGTLNYSRNSKETKSCFVLRNCARTGTKLLKLCDKQH